MNDNSPYACSRSNIAHHFFIKILALLLSAFLLTSCSGTYNSEDIPSVVKTSDITYINAGSIALDALIAKDYINCRYFVHVAPEYQAYESLSPYATKTIKYPSDQVNTTSINYLDVRILGNVTETKKAFGTLSFKVNHGEHYYVLMSFDKKSQVLRYQVFSTKNGIRQAVPIVKRKRKDIDEVCTPLTPKEIQLLS